MEAPKRAAGAAGLEIQVSAAKRARTASGAGGALVARGGGRAAGSSSAASSLEAPVMCLTGHGAGVQAARFSPDGTVLATGSEDKQIFLWRAGGACDNFCAMKGHGNVVLEVAWTPDGSRVVSASPDKTARAWDAESGQQVKKMAEHSDFVNSVCPARRGPPLVVTGSDDGTAKVWDLRVRGCVQTLADRFQVLAVAFSGASDAVFTGGIDNTVKQWDLRKAEASMTLAGHSDTVTGVAVSPDGSHVLSNAMDNTLRVWDVRPYAEGSRCTKTLVGHAHSFEKNLLKCAWSPDGARVAAGSGDGFVYVWDTATKSIAYKLPGHAGSVNEVAFHPKEPVIASAGSDKKVFLGEIAP